MAIVTSTRPPEYTELVRCTQAHYRQHRRSMPWRDELSDDRDRRSYQVIVSEVMLQQTQVARVIPKYEAWMRQFPTMHDAASASLGEILILWQGLGYNRRAMYLHETLQRLSEFGVPSNLLELQYYRGIGPNTAAAISVYVDDRPEVFIETNIRTVVLEHVFHREEHISDAAIKEVVQAVLPERKAREWYWALMDYGSYLKSLKRGHLHRAANHVVQPRFEGSMRQLRGRIVRYLTQKGAVEWSVLVREIDDERLDAALVSMLNEGLLEKRGVYVALPGFDTVQ